MKKGEVKVKPKEKYAKIARAKSVSYPHVAREKKLKGGQKILQEDKR